MDQGESTGPTVPPTQLRSMDLVDRPQVEIPDQTSKADLTIPFVFSTSSETVKLWGAIIFSLLSAILGIIIMGISGSNSTVFTSGASLSIFMLGLILLFSSLAFFIIAIIIPLTKKIQVDPTKIVYFGEEISVENPIGVLINHKYVNIFNRKILVLKIQNRKLIFNLVLLWGNKDQVFHYVADANGKTQRIVLIAQKISYIDAILKGWDIYKEKETHITHDSVDQVDTRKVMQVQSDIEKNSLKDASFLVPWGGENIKELFSETGFNKIPTIQLENITFATRTAALVDQIRQDYNKAYFRFIHVVVPLVRNYLRGMVGPAQVLSVLYGIKPAAIEHSGIMEMTKTAPDELPFIAEKISILSEKLAPFSRGTQSEEMKMVLQYLGKLERRIADIEGKKQGQPSPQQPPKE